MAQTYIYKDIFIWFFFFFHPLDHAVGDRVCSVASIVCDSLQLHGL